MRPVWALLILCAIAPLAAQGQVRASLVAAEQSAQPGHPLRVALRMDHDEHWHSYWINAGTGYPTSIKWDLPAGWNAGGIEWPTPSLIKDSQGNVTGHGYEGVLHLPVTLTPPTDIQPGQRIELRAEASWLMCADVCIPGKSDVALTLPVSTEPPAPNAAVQAALARQSMPRAAEGWAIDAARSDGAIVLRVSGPTALEDAHFYSEKEFIQYDQPQAVSHAGNQTTLRLPLAEDQSESPDALVGVLAYTDQDGRYHGLKIDAPIGAAALSNAQGDAARSLSARILLLALLGGLILNLMPCVFPVLGIKVVGFVNEAGSDRRRVTLHGLAFTLGVLLSFWALAAVLAMLRAGGEQLGWGFQLQSAPFVFALAAVMLVFAMSLSGVFHFGLRATTVGSDLQMKQGFGGSFFTGVLATVVATPCSAPFLAPALGVALALPVAESFAVFTAVAIGLAAPYLLLSIFPRAIAVLPKPGRWMETFKELMAFPLYATVAFLVWVLAGQTSENGLLSALFGLTLIAMAAWLYGRYSVSGTSRRRVGLAYALAIGLLALGLNLGWPRVAEASDVVWEPWSTERVSELQAEGRPIYVDFTARWCATCQANKKVVFGSEKVRAFFHAQRVATLKADWTNDDPRITAELARWNRSAVPFNLVYLPGSPEPKPLPEILTPTIVLDALNGQPRT